MTDRRPTFQPGDKVLIRQARPCDNWPEDMKATVVRAAGLRVLVSSKTCPDEPFWTDAARVYRDPEFAKPGHCEDCGCALAATFGGLEEHGAGCKFFPF